MAEIATSLAIKAAEQLVETVYEKISDELSLLTGLREAVEDIIRELKVMNAYLRDAEEKVVSSEATRAWMNELKVLSYEIEDCLGEVFLHLSDQRNQNTADTTTLQSCLHRLALCCGSLGDRHRIVHQIQRVKSKAEKIHNIKERYGITINTSSSLNREEYMGAQLKSQLAALYTEDSQLVGIDERIKELLNKLDQNEYELRLVVVVGGGGIGKTTIARKAYDLVNFTCRAWITVSQVYHPEGLLREMIKQLNHSTENNADKLEGVELTGKLREYLKDKRYVIILDDVWKEDAWESLRHALPTNDLGSRVILTTRKEDVANYCCRQIRGYTYYPMKLSPKEAMELFCKRAFNNPEQRTCPKDLKEITEVILHKCDGLPLAIISIAGLMSSKPNETIEELENILRHFRSKLLGGPEGAERVLTLSYIDLPYQVKPCFLYLSKFPEDYEMQCKDIQMLWIAEGLVAGRDGMTAEEVAGCYFNELTNRFLILPTSFSKVNGKVKTFRLHDIIRELMVSKSQEENFMTVIGEGSRCIPADDGIRRLSIHSSYNPKGMDMSHVRSLFMFGGGTMTVSPSMRMLQVLDMDCHGSGHLYIEIPNQLVHLKCLRLRGMDGKSLPESLGRLQNLEILDLRGCDSGIDIPSGVSKLQKLRVLRGECLNLPRGIGSLRTLQELACADVIGVHVAREIGKLTQLRKLGIRLLPDEPAAAGICDGFCKSLEALSSSLRPLKVFYPPFPSTLYNLSSPPLLLESLGLSGTIGLPNWVGRLNKVVRMTLDGCELEDGDVKVLGSLPSLTKLCLINNHYPKEIFPTGTGKRILSFGAEGFPHLKVLQLMTFGVGVRLSFVRGTMPHLESIILVGYGIETKEGFGLTNLPSLKEVEPYGDVYDAVIRDPTQHPHQPRVAGGYLHQSTGWKMRNKLPVHAWVTMAALLFKECGVAD